jgi:hypothetical protein
MTPKPSARFKIDTNRDGIDIDGCINVRIPNCSDTLLCIQKRVPLRHSLSDKGN